MRVPASPAVMVGSAAVGAAVVLLGMVVGRSVLSSPSSEPAVSTAMTSLEAPVEPEVRKSVELDPAFLREVVNAAPFDPARTPPAERYRMPGEQLSFVDMPVVQREPEPAPAFQLLGTAASADGGVAIIRLESGTPQFVSAGQTVNGYRVASIDAGRVLMTNGERTISLAVASASPTPQRPQQNGRNNRRGTEEEVRRPANAPRVPMTINAAALAEQMQRIQNLPPEQRAAAMQQFQNRIQQGTMISEVQVDGDRVRMFGVQVDGNGGATVVQERVVAPQGPRATPPRQ